MFKATPVRIGLLFDFPQADGGVDFEGTLRLGVEEVSGGRVDRDLEFLRAEATGLPAGTEHAVVGGFRDLEAAGCLAIIGPSISDNGLIVAPLADAAELSCLNYTGGERTRGHYGFHYQVGSLEEEPVLLAQRLAARGLRRPAVVSDRSPVGRRYAEWFEASTVGAGLEVAGAATVSPVAEDLTPVIERLRGLQPDALVYLGLGVSSRPVAVALASLGWDVPVVANSALLFGYARPDWRDGWKGWEYVDVIADDNERRRRLAERSPRIAGGPMGCAALDMGRLLGEALARADHLTRHGIRDAFERVKLLPATCGHEGTTLTFGFFDHGALHGDYLVLRTWVDGRSVQVGA
ncbi:MAG TPA: ABC transporter substrate-binding protein [Acidimicrobiia bacterium]|nr:ABC transporter substrate-binding protein [Acidimicrobiia bacterium]